MIVHLQVLQSPHERPGRKGRGGAVHCPSGQRGKNIQVCTDHYNYINTT